MNNPDIKKKHANASKVKTTPHVGSNPYSLSVVKHPSLSKQVDVSLLVIDYPDTNDAIKVMDINVFFVVVIL